MSKAYIRYTKQQNVLNDARGLLVTALKKSARPYDYRHQAGPISPNDYRFCYQPGDFWEMDVVLENRYGTRANLKDLKNLLPHEMFEDGLAWVLAGVVLTGSHIELFHVGFDTPHVIAESIAFLLTESKSSYAQTRCIGVCGAEISFGDKVYKIRFDVDGGGISGLPEEYAEISTVVSEYHNGVLDCDYFVPEDAPIIVHQYLPENRL